MVFISPSNRLNLAVHAVKRIIHWPMDGEISLLHSSTLSQISFLLAHLCQRLFCINYDTARGKESFQDSFLFNHVSITTRIECQYNYPQKALEWIIVSFHQTDQVLYRWR